MFSKSEPNPYDYFKQALFHWMNNQGRGSKKILSLETNRTTGYISKLTSTSRKKPIPFEIQIELAEACGYEYIEFLQLGKNLIEGKESFKKKPEPSRNKKKAGDPVLKDEDPIYDCFFRALTHEIKTNWYRQQSALSLDAGISTGYLTDILKGRTKASYPIRNVLSKACGYSYEDFLRFGKDLIEGNASSKKQPEGLQMENAVGQGAVLVDPALQLLLEALEETGVELNKKRKEALIEIVREDLKKSEVDVKENMNKYLRVFCK